MQIGGVLNPERLRRAPHRALWAVGAWTSVTDLLWPDPIRQSCSTMPLLSARFSRILEIFIKTSPCFVRVSFGVFLFNYRVKFTSVRGPASSCKYAPGGRRREVKRWHSKMQFSTHSGPRGGRGARAGGAARAERHRWPARSYLLTLLMPAVL